MKQKNNSLSRKYWLEDRKKSLAPFAAIFVGVAIMGGVVYLNNVLNSGDGDTTYQVASDSDIQHEKIEIGAKNVSEFKKGLPTKFQAYIDNIELFALDKPNSVKVRLETTYDSLPVKDQNAIKFALLTNWTQIVKKNPGSADKAEVLLYNNTDVLLNLYRAK